MAGTVDDKLVVCKMDKTGGVMGIVTSSNIDKGKDVRNKDGVTEEEE